MLRSVRSLPSLKVLDSNIKKEVQNQSKQFSTVSSRYNLVVPDIPHHEHRPYTEFTRSVHQTTKTSSTLLSTTKKSEFVIMSLNTLKAECRKRGLKVSGRKADLVSRIQVYENSYSVSDAASMSTSAKSKAPVANASSKPNRVLENSIGKKSFSNSAFVGKKGDDSHIDYIKPIDQDPPKLVEDDYIVQIPSISTEASKTPVTKLEKELQEGVDVNINEQIIAKADGSDSKIFESGSLKRIEEQNEDAFEVVPEKVFEDVAQEQEEEHYEYDNSEIPAEDKKFWAGVLAAVGVWWFFKPKANKKK